VRVATLVVFALAACRSGGGGGSRSVDILALGGDQPEPGAGVISHTRDGAVIDRAVADIVGRALIGVDDDSLISVVFPGSLSSTTPIVSILTTSAPPSDVALTVHGPDQNGPPPLIVGVLEIDAPNLVGATYFLIDVGCATVSITKFPEFIDIGACSMGSDTSLDVLARGYHDLGGDPPSPVLDGYAAGRAKMVDGHAILDLPAWQTSGALIPISVADTPTVTWTLLVDGVPFIEGEPITGSAFAYANLAVDETQVVLARPVATGARVTHQYVSGVPTSITATDADFLAAFDLTTELVGTSPVSVRWNASTDAFDAVHLHVSWGGSGVFVVPGASRVVWDAVLPPDATGASLPALDDDLGALLTGEGIMETDVSLRHLDSSALADFAALQGAGIHVENTRETSSIVPPPTDGTVRTSHALGLR
jgi:hypothetical protein